MTRRPRGFSLPEVLLVLVILGFLAAIVWGRLRQSREEGFMGQLRSTLAELRIAEESYWAEHKRYSADPVQLGWKSASDVAVRITSSDPLVAYDAVANHPAIPGVGCSLSVRRTEQGASGEVICK